jgi:cell wall assembly regulator SMI1
MSNDPLRQLRQAIFLRNIDKVKQLIAAGVPVTQLDAGFGDYPITRAADLGEPEIVKALLQAGADPNAVDPKFGSSGLIRACSNLTIKKGHVEVVKLLIAAGANANHMTKNNYTALWSAVADKSKSRMEIVKALIAAGADVKLGANLDHDPLARAQQDGSPEMVAALIAARAKGKVKSTPARKKQAGKTPPVAASWKKIESWLAENDNRLKKTLKKAATDAKINKLEAKLGHKLPADFKQSWKIHNGQKYAEGDLVPPTESGEAGYFLLALDNIWDEWKSWKAHIEAGQFADLEGGPDKGIRSDWWHPGWVPFASNGGGDLLCIDLAPDKGGTVGQVITMNHESPDRTLLAKSFGEWLAVLAEELDTLGA